MFRPALAAALPLAAGLAMAATGALACADDAKCLTAPESAPAAFAAGDVLPRGQYQVLLNSEYYGLPPARSDAWYFRVDQRVMRVDPGTMTVIEDVTELTNAAF